MPKQNLQQVSGLHSIIKRSEAYIRSNLYIVILLFSICFIYLFLTKAVKIFIFLLKKVFFVFVFKMIFSISSWSLTVGILSGQSVYSHLFNSYVYSFDFGTI